VKPAAGEYAQPASNPALDRLGIKLVCGAGSGAEGVPALCCAGVEALVLAGEVITPVLVEIAVIPTSG
jgi:hypothetical protein